MNIHFLLTAVLLVIIFVSGGYFFIVPYAKSVEDAQYVSYKESLKQKTNSGLVPSPTGSTSVRK